MQKNYPKEVIEYFKKKALTRWNLEWTETPGIRIAVIIPAICEFENIKKLLMSLALNDKSCLQQTIVIFIINNSVFSPPAVKADNKKSIEFLRALMDKTSLDAVASIIFNSGMHIGLIDASSEGKEYDDKTGGVGLARKIGMDAALKLFDYNVADKKILISLDADCTVEENYLNEIVKNFSKLNFSAANIEFEHKLSDENIYSPDILSYEIFLRHYVVGLLFARSPYAFHTIGSIMVCDHSAYIKSGGMNTKKAAEDFYFLQKLAAHHFIQRISTTKVKLSARKSWRVPFGTGRSMIDFSSGKKSSLVYDPDVYKILKAWLELFNSPLSLNSKLIIEEAKNIHNELFNFLDRRGFTIYWDRILKNSKSSKQLDYQRKNWFNAFETLKLIHHLRDTSFPMMDIKTGVEKLFQVVEHSFKFDLESEKKDIETLYSFYLTELKSVEVNLSRKIRE